MRMFESFVSVMYNINVSEAICSKIWKRKCYILFSTIFYLITVLNVIYPEKAFRMIAKGKTIFTTSVNVNTF